MSLPAPAAPGPPGGDGERFLELYDRYRDVVRQEMEAAGIGPEASERLEGAVFTRLAALVQAESPPDPMVATIRTLAREVSTPPPPPGEPTWRPDLGSRTGRHVISGG